MKIQDYKKAILDYTKAIELNPNYMPALTIIISTYNEEKVIEKRLGNILDVDYPKSKIEVIHVDSASTDNTVLFAKKFAIKHPDVNIRTAWCGNLIIV